MAKYSEMSIEELEEVRADLQQQMEAAQIEFRKAGKALGKARANTPEARAMAKVAEGRAELDALSAEVEAGDMEVSDG